jgi:hypothetical protein
MVTRIADELERLRNALSDLYDEQNDAPLEKRRPQWEAAMEQARKVLGYNE